MDPESLTRRELLSRIGMGMGTLALTPLLRDAGYLHAAGAGAALTPTAAKLPQFAPRAKHVIHIFLNGGPSHIDTFDPKPMLKKLPAIEVDVETAMDIEQIAHGVYSPLDGFMTEAQLEIDLTRYVATKLTHQGTYLLERLARLPPF